MLKKLSCLLIVMLLLMTGCGNKGTVSSHWKGLWTDYEVAKKSFNTGEPSAFAICEVDGRYYLNFVDGNGTLSNDCGVDVHPFSYHSIEEMAADLQDGYMSDWQASEVKTTYERDENGILFFDLNHLYKPILPKKSTVQMVNIESGGLYCFGFDDNSCFWIYPQKTFQEKFKEDWIDCWNRDTVEVLKTDTKIGFLSIPQKSIIVYQEFTSNDKSTVIAHQKSVRYTLETDHTYLYVNEQYDAKENGKFEKKPYTTVYGVGTNGSYFVVTFKFKPTVTFLSQLGTTLIEN